MNKSISIKRWLTSLLCGAIVLGSVGNITSFSVLANRYSDLEEITAKSTQINRTGILDEHTAIKDSESRTYKINANPSDTGSEQIRPDINNPDASDPNTTKPDVTHPNMEKSNAEKTKDMATESNAQGGNGEKETNASSGHTGAYETNASFDHYDHYENNADSEVLVIKEKASARLIEETAAKEHAGANSIDPAEIRAESIQDGLITEEFAGTVTFSGANLVETITGAYLEFRLDPSMLEGILTDFGSTLVDDLNKPGFTLSGFHTENGPGGEYIQSVNYSLVQKDGQNPVLLVRVALNPLTRQTDGSIRYRIRLRNDNSVPDGYILPVDASFCHANGEILLKTETVYFRAFYPKPQTSDEVPIIPSAAENNGEPGSETSGEVRPVPGNNPIPTGEIPPAESIPTVEDETLHIVSGVKPKKNVETTDIRVDLKWEGDLNVRKLRPNFANVVLTRQNRRGETEFVASIELSGRAVFQEIWTSTFEDVEKTDEDGNAYEFFAVLEISENSGISNYILSDPIRSLDGSRFTWIAKYNPISLNARILWEDNQNEHQVRPASVSVQLMSRTDNGEYQNNGEKVLIQSGLWQHAFGDYPRFDENGREIQYFLAEVEEEGLKNYPISLSTSNGNIPNRVFSIDNGNMTITNSIQEIEVPIRIYWNEKGFGNRYRPREVELKLVRDNGSTLHTITKVFSGGRDEEYWNGYFDNLVKYDRSGAEYRYYLIESNSLQSRNYDLFNTYKTGDTINIVNQLALTDEIAKISWEGQTHIPNMVELALYRNTVGSIPAMVDRVRIPSVLSEYRFADLPKFSDAGQIYFYSIRQIQENSNFSTEYQESGNITRLTNRYNGIELGIDLEWDDKDPKRPDNVKIRLQRRSGREDFSDVPNSDVVLDAKQNRHDAVYRDLPNYSQSGEKYEYRVREVPDESLKEYFVQYTRMDETTYKIAHTRSDNGIVVRIDWMDFENRYRSRPDRFAIQLYQIREEQAPEKVGAPIVATADNRVENGNSWEIRLTNFPRMDENKKRIRYMAKMVSEGGIENYRFDVPYPQGGTFEDADDQIVVTGRLMMQKIPIVLHWEGEHDAKTRPSEITIRLNRYSDGVKDESFAEILTVDTSANSASFDTALKADAFGREYEYRPEILNPNTLSNYEILPDLKSNSIVYNFRYISENIFFRMTWDDKENVLGLRPEKIHFQLARRLKHTSNPFTPVSGYELSPDGNYHLWTHTFKNLPKFDANGNEYEYGILDNVKSDALKNYKTNVRYIEGEHTIDVNAEFMPKSIEAEVNWVGDLNRESGRPAYLVAHLYKSSRDEAHTLVETKHIRGNDSIWSVRFRDLPWFDKAGNEYQYSVKIDRVPNYILTQVNQGEERQIADILSDKSHISMNKWNAKQEEVNPISVNPNMISEKFIYTLQLDVRTIKARVIWNDFENEYGLRPASIQVLLKRSIDRNNYEYVGKPVQITAPHWVANFGALPTKDSFGNVYDYKIEEVRQPSLQNYSEAVVADQMFRVQDNTILVSHDLNLNKIPVKIHWDGSGDIPKQIHIKLTRYGSTPIPTFTKSVNVSEQIYESVFEDMPMYDIKGNPFVYKVTAQDIKTGEEYFIVNEQMSEGIYYLTIR